MSFPVARRMDGIERTLIRRIFDGAPKGSINLGLGQPDLPTPARICLAGIDGIVSGKTGYTSTAGDPAVRAAVAARYPGFAGGPENVVVTIGSQEAVFAAAMTLVDAGDEVLVPDPGYPAYPVVAQLLGATPAPYPLRPERGFRIDPADVVSRLTPRTRLVILCSPSNPTGAMDIPGPYCVGCSGQHRSGAGAGRGGHPICISRVQRRQHGSRLAATLCSTRVRFPVWGLVLLLALGSSSQALQCLRRPPTHWDSR